MAGLGNRDVISTTVVAEMITQILLTGTLLKYFTFFYNNAAFITMYVYT